MIFKKSVQIQGKTGFRGGILSGVQVRKNCDGAEEERGFQSISGQ
jgi:hypothetical protein